MIRYIIKHKFIRFLEIFEVIFCSQKIVEKVFEQTYFRYISLNYDVTRDIRKRTFSKFRCLLFNIMNIDCEFLGR